MKLSLVGYSLATVILFLSPYVEANYQLTPDQVLATCYSKNPGGDFQKNHLTPKCLQKIMADHLAPEGLDVVKAMDAGEKEIIADRTDDRFDKIFLQGLEYLKSDTARPLKSPDVVGLVESICSREHQVGVRSFCYLGGLKAVSAQYPPTLANVLSKSLYEISSGTDDSTPELQQAFRVKSWKNLSDPYHFGAIAGPEDIIKHLHERDIAQQKNAIENAQVIQQEINAVATPNRAAAAR